MKTAGWLFIVIGALAFLGAISKGNSVFGPLFWIGMGSVLIYLKSEKREIKEEKPTTGTTLLRQPEIPLQNVDNSVLKRVEQCTSVSFEQKEAAICLIAFFAGYNDNIDTNDAVYMVSYQAAIFFGIENYKEVLTGALPKYQDADKLIDTILTIKDGNSREFLLLTCYDLTKMSRKTEAYEFLYNIANEMGYNKDRFNKLINQYSERLAFS